MTHSTIRSILFTLLSIILILPVFSQWEYMAPMPTARGGTAVSELDGKIYVMGGTTSDNSAALTIVEVYDPELNIWETGTVPEMPYGTTGASANVVNGKIYVIGGSNINIYDRIMIYDPDSLTWTYGKNMPIPLNLHASVVIDEKIYVTGGLSTYISLNVSYMYDPAGNTWEELDVMPYSRALHTASAVNGKIYALGGAFLGECVLNMAIFDSSERKWTTGKTLQARKIIHGGGVCGRYIYVYGGITSISNPENSPSTWRFNTENEDWEYITEYPEYIIHTGYCDYTDSKGNNQIFSFGGNTEEYYSGGSGPKVVDFTLRLKASDGTSIPGGPVCGTWTLDSSPYYITGDIWVEEDCPLVIEAGVEVIFEDHYQFNIYGQLLAIGEKDQMITFTANDSLTAWNGLKFMNISENIDSSILKYCDISYGFPQSDNDTLKCGGAVGLIRADKVKIESCILHGNRTEGDNIKTGGAGICVAECSPDIFNNTIRYNESNGHGGGIYLVDSNSKLYNNLITYNDAWGGGGIAIHCSNNSYRPLIMNNNIVFNNAQHGGGLDFVVGAGWIINSIIWGNQASTFGDQVHLVEVFSSRFYNNNIEGGFEAFAHDTQNSPPPSIGAYQDNIDSLPNFVDDQFNLCLSLGSPCIQAGIMSIEILGSTYQALEYDQQYKNRPDQQGLMPDIGALEHLNCMDIPNNLVKNKMDLIVFPNPFMNSTNFKLNTNSVEIVVINIYDQNGSLIEQILERITSPGEHFIRWKPKNLVPGIFFYSIHTKKNHSTGKLYYIP